ncbi:Conserved hypothetical protein [Prochlorococcus marinus subsp. pastoris str. CCMP1986]|uniref:Uncharacterized protein n=1 Tax=Prochlorococcus marinus subsp. pastoris (strain CCMP1986 / NIES-2087 / MED4) TaxID=59919 RepID=A8WIH6_PROMP|nr:hypothetical protein [Prochlorococcus marinus]KGF87323.1 hypothetical protein PROCH_0911 [Prochlorococcus marinus str. EQPAC1]CAP16464.1 Conserved hypothetical protein [Prochlorococcus marinus subsp. pastoris str. CCMP1986]|tara:strand:- start:459 stop:638 length:180 start_codon:yes stop_codon:yes gene_type:complete
MANPNQKTILIEEISKDIIKICKKFQADSGSSDSEVKTLLKEIARLWEIEEKNKFGFRL